MGMERSSKATKAEVRPACGGWRLPVLIRVPESRQEAVEAGSHREGATPSRQSVEQSHGEQSDKREVEQEQSYMSL